MEASSKTLAKIALNRKQQRAQILRLKVWGADLSPISVRPNPSVLCQTGEWAELGVFGASYRITGPKALQSHES